MLRKLSLILAFLPLVLQAQITAPASSAVRYTKYSPAVRRDPVYIFCTSSSSDLGALYASSPGGTPPFTFTWTRYDQAAKSYSIPVKTETGTTSVATELPEGGYRVHITDGSYSAYFYAWVNLDKPTANAALNTFSCTYLSLDGTASVDNFYYYDATSGAAVKLPDEIATPVWSSVPSSTIPPNEIDPFISGKNLPYIDITYKLQVVDSFGCVSSSSFLYESIHVKADFTAIPVTGEAPLKVAFTDNSIRAIKYTWDFGDDSISHLPDPPEHVYYVPGDYTVTLTVESDLFCIDESDPVVITVEPSKLDLPNVFTPNDDGINDYFVPEMASLKFVSIQIFSKSGQRVYHYEAEGEDVSGWNGWDGKINKSDRFAEPGVYYYVLRAKGYDDIEYKGSEFRGIIYLYR